MKNTPSGFSHAPGGFFVFAIFIAVSRFFSIMAEKKAAAVNTVTALLLKEYKNERILKNIFIFHAHR